MAITLEDSHVQSFLAEHSLQHSYWRDLEQHVYPVVEQLTANHAHMPTQVIGISGGQGTGKSTLAHALSLILEHAGYHCATLSIDDIYLRKQDRLKLSKEVHPLFKTRGVPGTHDVALGIQLINQLKTLGDNETKDNEMKLVRFNKTTDDRANESMWDTVQGPVDFVFFEGWCVAATPQNEHTLRQPINDIENYEDAQLVWRKYINRQLAEPYAKLFSLIDYLIYIQTPAFDQVLQWRSEQEDKLEQRTGKRGLAAEEIERFILLDQRITLDNLDKLPDSADAVLVLDKQHRIIEQYFNQNTSN